MKKTIIETRFSLRLTIIVTGILLSLGGCKKYLDISLPSTQIAAEGAFVTNASTSSVLSGVFYKVVGSSYLAGGSGNGLFMGLYTDELNSFNPNSGNVPFFKDDIQSASVSAIWTPMYDQLYECNVAIEGIHNSKAILSNKSQYLGEAYFIRAWLYFNLVNIYGGVPLAVISDYKVNNVLSRSTAAQVYAQVLSDLKTAESLLSADYHDGLGNVTPLRTRPDKFAATALLARYYLYHNDWVTAESSASTVINNTVYQLAQPSQTFLATDNTEMIWGLLPTGVNFVGDYAAYDNGMPATIPADKTLLSYGPSVSLSDSQVNNFEANDKRFSNWVRATFDPNTAKTYYFPDKYKSNVNGVEDVVVLRLAEQYLIRAEARAKQGEISGAQEDLNVVRTRAGLPNTTAATQEDLLAAIMKERRSEFFTEQGHRFFDLKRTGTIDAVMNVVAPQKGGTWNTQKQLWPISSTDIIIDPNLIQNPGYK
jgi:hypothetical protein